MTAVTSDPQTGNMGITTDVSSFFAFIPVYSALVWMSAQREALPELAESWTISPDGRQYDFKLRANAKFHDGRPVTSADVKYSVEEVAAKYQAKAVPVYKNIDRIETPNDTTVTFFLKQPSAVFLLSLTNTYMVVLPKHVYDGSDPRNNPTNTAPIGSGPFRFKEWLKGDRVTLTRNDDYYMPGLPYLDTVIARVIPDPGSRTIAFQKGEIDFLGGQLIDRAQIEDLKSVPEVYIDDHSGLPGQVLLQFNTTREPLNDVRVRRALAHAINQQAVVERAFFNAGAFPSTSHIMTNLKEYHNPNIRLPEYNVARANQLLDEAGRPKGADGTRFRLQFPFSPTNASDRRAAEIVRDNLKDVGVAAELVPMEPSVIAREVFTNGNFDMMAGSYTSNGDPELGIARFYTTASIGVTSGNGSRYSNPEVDKLFAEGGATIDKAARAQAYFKVQEILAADLPVFPLVDYSNIDVHRGEIRGVSPTPLGYPYYKVDTVWRVK